MSPTAGVHHDEDGDDLYDIPNSRAVVPPPAPTPGGLLRVDLVGTPLDTLGGGSPLDSATRHETAAVLASLANGTTPPAGGTEVTPNEAENSTPKGTKRATPMNSSRHTKAKQGAARIHVGGRCKTTRGQLFHLLSTESQKATIREFNNNHNCYGTIKSGSSNQGYNVVFDCLPTDEKEVFIRRKNLTAIPKGYEEVTFDRSSDDPEKLAEIRVKKSKKLSPFQVCNDKFLSLEEAEMSVAKTFDMHWSNDDGAECVPWKILPDGVHVTEAKDPMYYPDGVAFKKQVDIGDSGANTDFAKFMPDLTGMAAKIDKFHSSIKSPMYSTVKSDRIQFYDEDGYFGNKDGDWMVKQCFLLLIASCLETENGSDLWKRGPSSGRKEYPDFGQYLPLNYWKAFTCAVGLCFGPEEYWYLDKRDVPWDAIVPAVIGFNKKRQELFWVVLLMLDESMIGWRPKSTKTGGLPNLTYEPRKPVPLGTMLRNGVECITGCIAMNAERQNFKKYLYADKEEQIRQKSSLPGKPDMPAHTAEVLRQVEDAQVVKNGWCGGDAWFGSVATCVELKKRFGVHSTFIVKNNKAFYPMEVLNAVLKARHGDKPAGHWVVMTTTIAGVDLLAIAYAWSQKGVSYFISSCGEPSEIKYESKFEDEWGNTGSKLINRPKICHFIYEYLPLIDEHNKQRQNLLALEKCWQTKNPWMRIALVDLHRYYRYQRIVEKGHKREAMDQVRIMKMADLVCAGLKPWMGPRIQRSFGQSSDIGIERCRDSHGNLNREVTAAQLRKGRTVGNLVTKQCWICRGYLDKNGNPIQCWTSMWCKFCHAPLCNKDRTKEKRFGPDGRDMSCVDTHFGACHSDTFGCGDLKVNGQCFPKADQINQHPRRSRRGPY
ncbi:unknown protein [Seminavis robusta]|uniref:PiggyBac transposable element-derived protein domain-containing protein n=1 Tax=Seminavis robusta TaxID=568900 RepID=A0A9N8E839_9STRA|nr:unknown protein [Seminavis robusta]|eukprot:Sro723_g193040.1 n/a (882) ;mRNA; f:35212-37907